MSTYYELPAIKYGNGNTIRILSVDSKGNICLSVGMDDYHLVSRDGNDLIKIGEVKELSSYDNIDQFVSDADNNIYAVYDGYIHGYSSKGEFLGKAESICVDSIVGIDDENIFVVPQSAVGHQISVIRKADLYPYDEFIIPGGYITETLCYDRRTKEFSYEKDNQVIFFNTKGKELRRYKQPKSFCRKVNNGKSYTLDLDHEFLVYDTKTGKLIEKIENCGFGCFVISNEGEIIASSGDEIKYFLPKVNCVSHLFATTVLYSDAYLRMEEAADERKKRFFQICLQLPMELQMVIAHRLYQSGKQNVLSVDSEKYFREILN